MPQRYECDICGRACSRSHAMVAYNMDTICCDDCAGYEWEAYNEDPDPMLYPEDPLECEYNAREPHRNDTP